MQDQKEGFSFSPNRIANKRTLKKNIHNKGEVPSISGTQSTILIVYDFDASFYLKYLSVFCTVVSPREVCKPNHCVGEAHLPSSLLWFEVICHIISEYAVNSSGLLAAGIGKDFAPQ